MMGDGDRQTEPAAMISNLVEGVSLDCFFLMFHWKLPDNA
jgi:hypothetical protein